MKKLVMLLAVLMLVLTAAVAEEPAEEAAVQALPVEIIPQTEDMLYMTEAITKAEAALPVVPADCLTRAELVRMNDDSCQWVVSIYDLTAFTDGWCIMLDAVTGEVVATDKTDIGFFVNMQTQWESVKGIKALWSLEDKLLFDTLFNMMPTRGLPVEGDMSHGDALARAIEALGLTSAADYQIGYGYIMGEADGQTNGVWEVYFVQGDELVYKVNLDAVSGDIYLIEPDEEGNG